MVLNPRSECIGLCTPMISADIPAYLESWSEELASRSNRVRNLIGPRHWLSDGGYKEALIKEFLRRYLPRTLDIGRGFIRGYSADIVSPEVDLIVSDPARHVPIFREGDFTIVPPSSVLATIEVKSTYSADVLCKAIDTVTETRRAALSGGSRRGLWSAVFMVNSPKPLALGKIAEVAARHLRQSDLATPSEGADCYPLFPNLVSLLDSAIVLLDSRQDGAIVAREFQTGNLTTAVAFSLLFSHLHYEMASSPVPGELEDYIERLDVPTEQVTIRPPRNDY